MALYELADSYEPQRAGYAGAGRFSGYAAALLPRRLADAWHALHPEHQRVSANGERRWVYGPAPAALEDAEFQTNSQLVQTLDESNRLDAALHLLSPWERLGARRMVELAGEGLGPAEIAAELGLTREGLGELRERLRAALAEVERVEA